MPSPRSRVLLLAESANPEWVSVPLEGWSHARAIRSLPGVASAHLVTQIRNRDAIARQGWVEGKDFTAIDSESLGKWIWKTAAFFRGGEGKGWTTIQAFATLGNYHFEHLVWKQLKQRISAGAFDLVHRLTPLSPTCPSPIAAHCKRAGVPFVLGPLNGGVPWPRQFDAQRRKEKEWLSYVRGAYKLLPGYHATLRNAAAILVGSRDTERQVPQGYRGKCFYVPENAIDPERFTVRRQHKAARPIRVVFVGRLVPYKGADMLLEAAAPLVRAGAVTVEIIGDGPQMPELRQIVGRENLAAGVTLAGWVEHKQVQGRLAAADVFGFPSVREFGGAVALEAMAVGAVPVVLDYGGPGELVTPDTGFLVDIGTRAQVVERFRAVLSRLAQHPQEIEAKSAAAVRRAHEQFTWDEKARQVMEVYQWVREQHAARFAPRIARSGRTAGPLLARDKC